MKKLITMTAAVALVASSCLNSFFQAQKKPTINNINQNSNNPTTNEDAEDIADKLFAKTIKINPNYWLNKDIKNYQSQWNEMLVKNHVLTAAETQYVSWADLTFNYAGWFYNQGHFTVQKDGATAKGYFTVDADTGETTQQIAAKINTAQNIKFNYNYWNNKQTQKELPVLRNILVNEDILTKAEASVVAGVDATTIKQAGQINLKLNVNDRNTNTYANAKINVVNDGASTEQIAKSINNLGFGLKINTIGMYADSSYVLKNWSNLLTANYGVVASDTGYISLPHTKLQADNPNLKATIAKDGQITTVNIELECRTEPYIYYYIVNNNYIQAYVNLNAKFLSYLKTIFTDGDSFNYDLKYFYEMLDDDNDTYWLVDYGGPDFIPWNDRLNQNMGAFGDAQDPPGEALKELANTNISSIETFAKQLKTAVMNNSNGYLSLMFQWHYTYNWYGDDTYAIKASFW